MIDRWARCARFTARAMVIATSTLPVWGCDQDLAREDAAQSIEAHFQGIASSVPRDSLFDSVTVRAVLQADEFTREVRYALMVDTVETSGSMFFQRSDDGWVIARYGPGTHSLVAWLAVAQWRSQYRDLLSVIDTMNSLAMSWDQAISARQRTALDGDDFPRYLRLSEREKAGPTEEEFFDLLQDAGVAPPDGDGWEWGYERGTKKSAPALWVQRPDSVRCGVVFGFATDRPLANDWVGTMLSPACGERFMERSAEEVREAAETRAISQLLDERD